MSTVIDSLFFFICAFILSYGIYVYMYNRSIEEEGKESDAQRLKRRLNMLSKQQDELLENAGKVASTFTKITKQELDNSTGNANSLVERILIIMKKAGLSDIPMSNFVIYCSIGGMIFSFIILYFDFLNALTGIPIGMVVGAYLVYSFLKNMADKRKMAFLQQLQMQ